MKKPELPATFGAHWDLTADYGQTKASYGCGVGWSTFLPYLHSIAQDLVSLHHFLTN
jgi:hypothetical protein